MEQETKKQKEKKMLLKDSSSYVAGFRKRLNVSQDSIAKNLGFKSPQFISNWERGLSSIPAKQIRKIKDLYPDFNAKKYVALLSKDKSKVLEKKIRSQMSAEFKK